MRVFPCVYPVIDVECIQQEYPARPLLNTVLWYAQELVAGGATAILYRSKLGTAWEIVSHGRELRRALPESVRLIMNDRADLCLAVGFQGVHVGPDDLSPDSARSVVGPDRIVGASSHNLEEFRQLVSTSADYLAIGPISCVSDMPSPAAMVGIEHIRAARTLLAELGDTRPLIAFGKIARENAREVIAAGADSVIVVSELIHNPRAVTAEFLQNLL